MRAGQYANGLSARTGTTRSQIKHWIQIWFTPLARILISRVNVTEVFLHTIGVSESRDSLEVLFPTVSHDTFSHFHLRWMRRYGTRKNFAQHIHRCGRDNGNFPQMQSYSRYKLKHTQILKSKYGLKRRCVSALVGHWIHPVLSALDCSSRQPLSVSVSNRLDAPRPSMKPILGFLPSPGVSIDAVSVPLMPLLRCWCLPAHGIKGTSEVPPIKSYHNTN